MVGSVARASVVQILWLCLPLLRLQAGVTYAKFCEVKLDIVVHKKNQKVSFLHNIACTSSLQDA